jgi:hypothetical protein
VPPKRVLLLAVVLLAACSGDDDDATPSTTTTPSTGCPVAAASVADALGRPVAVDPAAAAVRACAFVGQGDEAAGVRVEVVAQPLAEEGFGTVLAEVERRAGPTTALAEGVVDGADRGWVASVGRAVQVGAADDETLVEVAVTDPLLDAEAARAVAARLAGEVLKA